MLVAAPILSVGSGVSSVGMKPTMSEFTSEGSPAADEEVAYVRSEPDDDPLSTPGAAAEGQAADARPGDSSPSKDDSDADDSSRNEPSDGEPGDGDLTAAGGRS